MSVRVRVIALPSLLEPADLIGRTAVVFDVVRATTTIAAALSAGAAGVQVYGSIDDAAEAAAPVREKIVLAGERHCVAPPGFDLGNSPGDFDAERVGGRTIYLATTNGTVALLASRTADVLLAGSLANASATAAAVTAIGKPVTLVASGTQGQVAMDDLLGCGAVLAGLPDAELENDTALLAHVAWDASKDDLPRALRRGASGHHLMNANLLADIDACAAVDRFPVVCRVHDADGQLIVRRAGA